ncbi:MAG: hypothetical protein OXG72_17935 [Acidobacteria bacterium]|nr:hypothetical protein [Acidobacteriota bacterium]
MASLLVHLERMPASTVIMAATNHPGMLDRATWRRSQIRLKLAAPKREALTEYFESRCPETPGLRLEALTEYFESRCPETPRLRLEAAAAAMTLEEASYAEAAEFCNNVERRRVLFPDEDPNRVFRHQLARWMTQRATTRHAPRTLPATGDRRHRIAADHDEEIHG